MATLKEETRVIATLDGEKLQITEWRSGGDESKVPRNKKEIHDKPAGNQWY